jgi:Ser/Thr protein kinase RdoA (MazF antagonist)
MDGVTQAEEPLSGGIEPGRVVRIGDTIRRPGGPWSSTVHALLVHLRGKGFPAPEPLGLDAAGREILSFLPGRASNWPWPNVLLETTGARKVGAFLARYHDAVADFRPPTPVWRHGAQALRGGDIVLHGDFAPHNLVWSGAEPSGLIDFELARPGRPLEDAGFCVVRTACFRDDAKTVLMGFAEPPDRRARLAAFAEGYGAAAATLLAEARASIVAELDRIERLGGAGLEPWGAFRRIGLSAEARAELAWLEAHAGALA